VKRTVVAILVSLVLAMPATAQRYVFPGKKTPAVCSKCLGKNAFGVPNKDLPTWPYDAPFLRHAGRFVDSSTTGNVQNAGLRTVRAGTVRVNRAKNRLYITLGEAVGGYVLDTFFEERLGRPMIPVSGLPLGQTPTKRTPLETVAKPDSLFYAESPFSGWVWSSVDIQRILTDFDSDDRGFVYIGTYQLGWGITRDLSRLSGVAMEYVVQVQSTPHVANAVISLKSGGKYYAVVSQNTVGAGRHTIFDVTKIPVPAAGPVQLAARPAVTKPPAVNPVWSSKNSGIVTWAKSDARERLAILDTAGHVRIFDYAAFLSGAAPRADFIPVSAAKAFVDLTFDEAGTLWIAEGPTPRYANPQNFNALYRAKESGAGYTRETVDVFGGPFTPFKISAAAGYVVVAGKAPDAKNVLGAELRLLNVTATPKLVPTGPFIRNFYAAGPAGYADPGETVDTWAVTLVSQGAATYLLYSAGGLGDVFQLPNAN